MKRFSVELKQKRNGAVEVQAEDEQAAIAKVKRMIQMDTLPRGAMEDESRIVIAYTTEVV